MVSLQLLHTDVEILSGHLKHLNHTNARFVPPPVDLLKKEKIMVDAKVYIFAMGMVQAFFKPRELPVLKQ